MCICTSHTSWGTEICKYIEYFLRGILRMWTRANRILTYLYVCISIVGNSSIYLYLYVHSGELREWTRANTSLSRMHCFTNTIRTDAFPFANFMSCILKTSSISIRHARCVTHAHAHTNIQAHTCLQTSTPTHKHTHSNTRTHRRIRTHTNTYAQTYTHTNKFNNFQALLSCKFVNQWPETSYTHIILYMYIRISMYIYRWIYI